MPEDAKIVEKALEAVRFVPSNLEYLSSKNSKNPLLQLKSHGLPKTQDLREEYLNMSIDPRFFLLLCISLGVGVVLRASDGRSVQLVDKSTGWDSFGIVSSKKDIVTMIMKFRS